MWLADLRTESKGNIMGIRKAAVEYCASHYKTVFWAVIIITALTGALIPLIKVDTDPENMLAEDEPVRLFHDHVKETFNLYDIIVVGVINEDDPDGVFNVDSLANIYELTEFSRKLQWQNDKGEQEGVVEVDIMAPSTVDHIEQGGIGEVRFEWLMPSPPETRQEALEIRDKSLSNPMLVDTLISDDGKALCLYLPISSKDLSYKVYSALREKIATFDGEEKYHITGLPVAEDTFGVEMFIQMAISAPSAMLVIFLLMLAFFRKIVLIILPMIIAMVSVITTMGIMIGLGFPVHIMSSMIPIFLMPIAVVDSVHILSEFFDLYTPEKGRKATVQEVISNLFTPMLYTSLTSSAGFASLALTPIPPVQVFGIFVAIGIMIAWLTTMLLTPAYVAVIKESSLSNFGHRSVHRQKPGIISALLQKIGSLTYNRAKALIVLIIIVTAAAVYGITLIRINDNPVKWFSEKHPIRIADTQLNKHFGGTYMAYLVLESKEAVADEQFARQLAEAVDEKANEISDYYEGLKDITPKVKKLIENNLPEYKEKSSIEMLDALAQQCVRRSESKAGETADIWYEYADFFELTKEQSRIFKQPEVLRYISGLEEHLESTGLVGKCNSVAGIVKKVYQELVDGKDENYRIPDSSGAVAQSLMQFQSSHNPDDLWRMVTYDYMNANIWVQLTSGDNRDMEKVVREVKKYISDNEPPAQFEYNWAGLTYINIIWQNKMVSGMLQSFVGSFLIVFIMMSILFRSPLWGIICMLPLTITIAVIYGIIGFIGKDYDMPVAVLSALTLGMAVDFAIHFIQRAKQTHQELGSWSESVSYMFAEPARAISKNVMIIAIGFLPLLAAPLIPYKTVGVFLCAIMALSGAVTLLILPAAIRLLEKRLFKDITKTRSAACRCGFCILVSTASVVLIVLNLRQNWDFKITNLNIGSAIAIIVLTMGCAFMSRRKACKNEQQKQNSQDEQKKIE